MAGTEMAATGEDRPQERATSPLAAHLDWVALGLWAASGVALAGAVARRAARLRLIGDDGAVDGDLIQWDAAQALLGALPFALVAGLLAGRLAAVRASFGQALLLTITAAVALLAALADPFAPTLWRSVPRGDLAADDLLIQGSVALGVALVLRLGARGVARRRERGRGAFPLAGPAACALAGVVGLLAPLLVAYNLTRRPPTFLRRMVLVDLLEREDLWNVPQRHPDRGPTVAVLTPAVDQHADTADKPSLWMPPPCTVEVDLPPQLPSAVLRAAAGVDRRVHRRLPEGADRGVVEFEIARNGETLWSARIDLARPRSGEWSSGERTWHHAGGPDGIPVEGGDRITFRTRVPDGDPAGRIAAGDLRVGFGTPVIEASVRTRRCRASPRAPNLVLIVMDTLRADRMSCYGYPKPTTPNLDRLARRGIRFENAYATSSWTWPSTASILTGLPADAHGVTRNESCTLNLALTSLPEALQARGYTTAAFSGNPLIAPERYFDQGFECFEGTARRFEKSDQVVPAALRWLDEHSGVRFFLYLHLVDPHTPHTPHPEELVRLGGSQRPADFPERGLDGLATERLVAEQRTGSRPPVPAEHAAWVRDVYDASVATGDRWVGVLLEHLEGLGLEGQTVVLFTADHGEELLDRDELGHGHGIHSELVRVPLILSGPGLPVGLTVDGVVSNRHLAPTLAMFAGTELPGMGDARLLTGTLSGESEAGALYQTSKGRFRGRRYQGLFGLRRGDHVLHWWADTTTGERVLSLYDARLDPQESADLAPQLPVLAEDLARELERRLEEQRRWAPRHQLGVGAGGLDMLYDIGYATRGEDGDGDGEGDGDR